MNIPSLKIQFTDEERHAILADIDECLRSGQLSQGKQVAQLEADFARYVGVEHAVAVSSGTAAIEAVMWSLLKEGQEVLVPSNTFLASARGALAVGGSIRLVDIDPKTLSVSLATLQERATEHTAGVIVVHIGGIITPEIERIRAWCDEQGYWLFEDCAHAHGSSYNGRFAGSFGIAGAYSFFATKIITSAEGGMIVTNDSKLAELCKLYRNHGKPEPWVTYHTHIGSNCRMHEMTAAIAKTQLAQLDNIINRRHAIAAYYSQLLQQKLPSLQRMEPFGRTSWYKYIVLLPSQVDRTTIKALMKEQGVHLSGGVYEIPLHRQPVFADHDDGSFRHTDDFCRRHICLPLYPTLTAEEVEYVVATLSTALAKAAVAS